MLPSDPVTITFVAFVADTDKVDDPPAAIAVGLAEMVTVGESSVLLRVTPPHPTARSKEIRAQYLNESTWRRFPNRGTTGKGFLPSIAHVVGFSRQSGTQSSHVCSQAYWNFRIDSRRDRLIRNLRIGHSAQR